MLTFVVYVGIFMRIPIIPLYAKSVGASTTQVGFIVASFMIIAASLAIPLGSLSDRFGRRRLIFLGVFLSAFTSFLLASTKNPLQIMLVYALAGLGASSFAPAIASFVGDVTSKERMGRAYGWYTSSMQVGMASGPAIGGLVAGIKGYEISFIVSGIVILCGLLIASAIPPPNAGDRSKTLTHIRKGLVDLGHNRKVLAAWTATFCIAFGFGVFQPFFPLYAQGIGLTAFAIGILFGVNSLFNAFARIPAGYISDRIGKRYPFIVGGMIAFAFSIFSIILFDSIYPLLLLVALAGLAMGITTMALSTTLAESSKRENRGIAMGGFSTSLYGGFAVSAAVVGRIIADYSFAVGFGFAGLICTIGALIFIALRG
jgi:MFS family permease